MTDIGLKAFHLENEQRREHRRLKDAVCEAAKAWRARYPFWKTDGPTDHGLGEFITATDALTAFESTTDKERR